MNLEEKINDLEKQIAEIQKEKNKFLRESRKISYFDRAKYLKCCFKDGDYFYKVIDCEIFNKYRVKALVVRDFTLFNINDLMCKTAYLFEPPYESALNTIISVESMLIKDLLSYTKISEAEFDEQYENNCRLLLNIDVPLYAARKQSFEYNN